MVLDPNAIFNTEIDDEQCLYLPCPPTFSLSTSYNFNLTPRAAEIFPIFFTDRKLNKNVHRFINIWLKSECSVLLLSSHLH